MKEKNHSTIVFSVQIEGVEATWENGCCSVENSTFRKKFSRAAAHLEEWVRGLGLLSNARAVDRFEQDGTAWVDIHTTHPANHEFEEFVEKASAIREKIMSEYKSQRSALESISQKEVGSSVPRADQRTIELLQKFIAFPPDLRVVMNFESEKIEVSPVKPVKGNIVILEGEIISGLIRYFDDVAESLVLFDLDGQPGQITLNLNPDANRRKLRDILTLAQHERRRVTIEFEPTKSILRPDKDSRNGIIKNIVKVGESQSELDI